MKHLIDNGYLDGSDYDEDEIFIDDKHSLLFLVNNFKSRDFNFDTGMGEDSYYDAYVYDFGILMFRNSSVCNDIPLFKVLGEPERKVHYDYEDGITITKNNKEYRFPDMYDLDKAFKIKLNSNNINEELDTYDSIVKTELDALNKWLDDYGFEVELVNDYNFGRKKSVGMFLNSIQDNASVFPIALNKKILIDFAKEESYDEYSYRDELMYGIRGTLWHEAGHGIYGYLEDFYEMPEDEEECVEEFARYGESSELFDILQDYMKQDESLNEEVNKYYRLELEDCWRNRLGLFTGAFEAIPTKETIENYPEDFKDLTKEERERYYRFDELLTELSRIKSPGVDSSIQNFKEDDIFAFTSSKYNEILPIIKEMRQLLKEMGFKLIVKELDIDDVNISYRDDDQVAFSKSNSSKYINESTGFPITVYTYQKPQVRELLEKGETYIADYSRANYNHYKDLAKVLGLNNCPIFGALSKDDLYDMLDSSGIDFEEENIIHLEIPKENLKYTEYYDWTDYMYALDDPESFKEESGLSIQELEDLLKTQKGASDYENCQVVFDRIEPQWYQDGKEEESALNEYFDNLDDYAVDMYGTRDGSKTPIYITDEVYKVKNMLEKGDKPYRILCLGNKYLIQDAQGNKTHGDMAHHARELGYITPDEYYDFEDDAYMVFIPKDFNGKLRWHTRLGVDNYYDCRVYSFGVIFVRDYYAYKNSLFKALGTPERELSYEEYKDEVTILKDNTKVVVDIDDSLNGDPNNAITIDLDRLSSTSKLPKSLNEYLDRLDSYSGTDIYATDSPYQLKGLLEKGDKPYRIYSWKGAYYFCDALGDMTHWGMMQFLIDNGYVDGQGFDEWDNINYMVFIPKNFDTNKLVYDTSLGSDDYYNCRVYDFGVMFVRDDRAYGNSLFSALGEPEREIWYNESDRFVEITKGDKYFKFDIEDDLQYDVNKAITMKLE